VNGKNVQYELTAFNSNILRVIAVMQTPSSVPALCDGRLVPSTLNVIHPDLARSVAKMRTCIMIGSPTAAGFRKCMEKPLKLIQLMSHILKSE
jgi:hypothetical protein